MFNSFFAGITSHVPFNASIEQLNLDCWLNFFNIYQSDYFGLKRTDDGKIKTFEPTGDMQKIHDDFKKYSVRILSERYPIKRSSSLNAGNESYPTPLTYIPLVIERLRTVTTKYIEQKKFNVKRIDEFNFLVNTKHPVLAKEIFDTGTIFLESLTIRFHTCRYFARVSNYEGYGLKYAIEYLKKKYPIDMNCQDMLIALDEPELIEYLMKYEKTNQYWASAMVRLTRKTFGSLTKDKNVENWEKYFAEVLSE